MSLRASRGAAGLAAAASVLEVVVIQFCCIITIQLVGAKLATANGSADFGVNKVMRSATDFHDLNRLFYVGIHGESMPCRQSNLVAIVRVYVVALLGQRIACLSRIPVVWIEAEAYL